MGAPRKIRRKYQKPFHPWQRARIEQEREILKEYALKNKKEIWKQQSFLRKFTNQTKKLISLTSEQSKKEKEQLINRLYKLGLVEKTADFDDVLSLTLKNIQERRLQTIIFKKGLSRTIKQARQFITHGHILVNGKRITSPSYIVLREEENSILFNPRSTLSNPAHKERIQEEEKAKKEKPKKPKRLKKDNLNRSNKGRFNKDFSKKEIKKEKGKKDVTKKNSKEKGSEEKDSKDSE